LCPGAARVRGGSRPRRARRPTAAVPVPGMGRVVPRRVPGMGGGCAGIQRTAPNIARSLSTTRRARDVGQSRKARLLLADVSTVTAGRADTIELSRRLPTQTGGQVAVRVT